MMNANRTVSLSLVLLAGALAALADSIPIVSYALADDSTEQEGCFEPCMCPILIEQPMTGSFDLVFYPFAGPVWTVGVERLAFDVPTLGKQITGQGIYKRAGYLQSLEFELQINGDAPRAFHSGWVEGGDGYPFIDVTLSMNDFFCYDIALRLHAKPVDAAPHLSVGRAQLSWTDARGATAYDVVIGDLTELRAKEGNFGTAVDACLADALRETVLPQNIIVAPGHAVWFLVRPEGGSYDAGDPAQVRSRDEGVASSGVTCP